MSTATKKPPPPNSVGRRPSTDPTTSAGVSPRGVRSSTPPSGAATNGVARARSVRTGTPLSARAAMQRSGAGASNLSTESNADEDDSRAELIALVEELKDRQRDTELKAEQFQKQAEVLQIRLDEAHKEHGKLEDRVHESEEKLEILEYEKRDAARAKREMESIYEAERSSMNRERDEMANREEELQTVIQRLKDSLSQRNNVEDERRVSRNSNNASPNIDSGHFAPSSALNRSDSRNNSKIVLQKDKLIESLRLELAEAQIKLVESENAGGGRMNEVERLLMETRMANARLMEDNESFQLLLQQKTLNGDFAKDNFGFSSSNSDALDALEGRTAVSSLADELASADEEPESDSRKIEAELKASKAENKALTLYINKIIERLLQHQDFEAILDQSSEFKPGATGNKDKELPPPPSEQPGMLQRAKSVISGTGKARPRPMSQMPAPHSALTDPETAPSIPFGVGRAQSVRKQRPQSEQMTGAAGVVNQMYRSGTGIGQISPPLHGPQTPRNSNSFFTPPTALGNPNAAARHPSSSSQVPTTGTFPGGRNSETSSIDGSSDTVSVTSSPPRPQQEKATTFAGNKPRPLRLVEDKKEEDTKKNNRASWMGWASAAISSVGQKGQTNSSEGVTAEPIKE